MYMPNYNRNVTLKNAHISGSQYKCIEPIFQHGIHTESIFILRKFYIAPFKTINSKVLSVLADMMLNVITNISIIL